MTHQPQHALAASTSLTPISDKLKVINLWSGPGAGKSTTAAAVFNLMKRERFAVEYVPEIAKALTYEKAFTALSNQLLVLAKQEHQLRRLIGQVEYAIVDSPFPLGLAYCKPEHIPRYEPLIDSLWEDYDNYNFFVKRTSRTFQTFGRNQNEADARALDVPILELALDYSDHEEREDNLTWIEADDPTAEYRVINRVLELQGLPNLTQRMTEVWPATGDDGDNHDA